VARSGDFGELEALRIDTFQECHPVDLPPTFDVDKDAHRANVILRLRIALIGMGWDGAPCRRYVLATKQKNVLVPEACDAVDFYVALQHQTASDRRTI
jgi:hypothetical protein